MLVLTRKVDERIRIGDDIEIVVTRINHRRDAVQLGISAPKDVPIFRTELLDRQTTAIPNRHFNDDEPLDY